MFLIAQQWSPNVVAGATVALVILTGFYAYSTHCMAKRMAKLTDFIEEQTKIISNEFELITRPYIQVCSAEGHENQNKAEITFYFMNFGKVPAKFDIELSLGYL